MDDQAREENEDQEDREENAGVPWAPESIVVRLGTSVGEALPNDFAVLDLDSGAYFSLGEVGGFIWDRLDGVATLAEIAAAIAGKFDVAEEQAFGDLERFVAALAARRLVRLVPGA